MAANKLLLTLALWISIVFPVAAEETPGSAEAASGMEEDGDPRSPIWKGEAEIGFVLTGGNTRTQSLNARLSALNEWPSWVHSARAEAIQSSDRGQTKAQRVALSGRSAYKITHLDSIFVKAKYEDDRFSGYDYRVSDALGYTRRLLDGPPVLLEASLGAGSRHGRLMDGTREDELVFNTEGLFEYRMSPAAALGQNVSVEGGDKGTVTESVTSLKSQLINNLAMKLSFTFRHNTRVPQGVKKADFHTAVTLVYGF